MSVIKRCNDPSYSFSDGGHYIYRASFL